MGSLTGALLDFFDAAARDLPWRHTRDPYAIWISEVMLQQTRVETVIGYYTRWLARFPDVAALAAAEPESVLAAWSGLGYYSRARNLHRAAQRCVELHGGEVPRAPGALESLPGIGPYTAGAVRSIAWGEPTPVVDGNVERVLCRLHRIEADPRRPATRRRLWELAAELVPRDGRSGDLNQALMELGATICTPRAPRCGACPIAAACAARAAGIAERLPRRAARAPVPTMTAACAALRQGEGVLVGRRPARGLWGGLWELPWWEVEAPEGAVAALAARVGIRAERLQAIGALDHVLTHRRLRFEVYAARARPPRALPGYDAVRLLPVSELADGELPVARVTRRLAALVTDPARGRTS